MALTFVRNDITKMQVDAIVNSTNEFFHVGGLGVDAGIHFAAGPELEKALARIGRCPVGSAVITDAFNISSCKYIIHAVGPVYVDGQHGEREQLKNCYRSILALARENGCRSLAIPSISTGAYGYPKAEAYSIATSCIREFLLSLPDEEDMMVYLVLFDSESVAVSEKIDAGVKQFIDDAYRQCKKESLSTHFRKNRHYNRTEAFQLSYNHSLREDLADYASAEEVAAVFPAPAASEACFAGAPAAAAPLPGAGYEKEDRSFADMCEWWCKEKGFSKKEFYTGANITRATFWGMKNHPPKKTTALACVIGLKLDYDQAIDLLHRAGLTLSKYYETDLIVEYFIREKNYDIDAINLLLYKKDLALLGQSMS